MPSAGATGLGHGAEMSLRRRLCTGLLSAAIAASIGASAVFTAAFFVQAHTPGMTRGRKRELVSEFLPHAMPVLAVLAAIGLALAVHRRGSLRHALWGDASRSPGFRRRALRVATVALTLALATPLLQVLCGLSLDLRPTQLFGPPVRALTSTLGILSSALQEDVLVRWLPIEAALLALLLVRLRETVGPVMLAITVSAAVDALAHSAHELALPGLQALLRYGLTKAPAAIVFAWIYCERGLVEAWLTHAATNLAILLLLPKIVGF